MIIVKLWGGMCNQMFQYAFGYALARKHNDDLAFDIDFYKNQPGHVGKRKVISPDDFTLSKLIFAERPAIVKIFENKYINHILRYSVGCKLSISGVHFLLEQHCHYYETVPYKQGRINYYDGYWQTALYSDPYKNELLREFTPSKKVLEHIKRWKESFGNKELIAVHIRRGDYLNKANVGNAASVYGVADYYWRAIKWIEERVEKPMFCFFSDDIGWCKEQFENKLQHVTFVENGKDDFAAIVDLFTMAACDHEIMSPSSFSWFGNWLRDPSKKSIVLYPKIKEKNKNLNDLSWIGI